MQRPWGRSDDRRRKRGQPRVSSRALSGRGVQIEAGGVDKALGRRVYDFILKVRGLENNHLPHLTTEGPFRQTKAPS